MTELDKCIALEQYRIQMSNVDTLSKVAMSALEGFNALGYKTKRLDTIIDNTRNLQLDYLDSQIIDDLKTSISLETSKDTRDGLVSLSIGARAQQIFDMIIGFILRLLGSRGQRPADMDIAIIEEIREIKGMAEERITKTRIPDFTHPQFKQNWETQWGSYRDTIAEVDERYKDMSPEEFYLNFKVPRLRELYISLGSGLMKRGLPICYVNGDRDRAFQRFIELIVNAKEAISKLRYVEINQDGSVTYDHSGIDELIRSLESSVSEDWEFSKKGRDDWLTSVSGRGVSLLRNIDGDMGGIENVTRLLSRAIRVDERIKRIVNEAEPAERDALARKLDLNMREWTNQLNTLVRLVGTIYSRIKSTEQIILKTIRQYRRTVDIIVKN